MSDKEKELERKIKKVDKMLSIKSTIFDIALFVLMIITTFMAYLVVVRMS